MKHKKPLLAIAAFSIFTGVGLATADTHAAEYETIVKTISCDTTTYKVDQDYDSSIHVIFQDSENCGSGGTLTFDLNGKTIADGTFLTPDVYNFDVIMQDSVGGGSMKNLGRHGGGPDDMIISHSSPKTLTIKSGVYDGIIDLNGGQATIENGVFSGSINALGTNALDIVDGVFNGITFSSPSSATILGGSFNGETTVQSGVNLSILGGSFSGNLTAADGAIINVDNASTRIITVPDKLTITGGTFSGDFGMQGNGEVNINSGTYTGSIAVTSAMKMYINGGNFVGALHGSNITISGGTFSTKPDEKYLATSLHGKFVTYEVDGKYVVAEPFFIYAPSYMVKGEESEVTGTPAFLWDDAEITSSDESVVKILSSKKEDGRTVFKFSAGKTGKATINFATTYESGSFDIYVDEVSSTNLTDEELQKSTRDITSILNCLMKSSDFIPSCTGLAPVFRDKDLNAAVSKVASAFKAGHALILELGETGVELSADQINQVLEAAPGLNILRSGRYDISVKDSVTKETLATEIPGTVSVDVPAPLEDRTITVVGTYGDKAMVTNLKIEDDKMFFPAYYESITILYDGDPISGKISKEDIPAVPNSAGFSDENSMTIILGASAALGLIIAVIAIYANGRKKALNKVRF